MVKIKIAGKIMYVCGNCSVDFSCTDNAKETSVIDVAIQCFTPNHCKSAQSQPQFVSSGSQTLISGNINESSFSSVDSYVNVCDSIILIRLIVIQIYMMLAFLKIRMSLIMSLNKEILSNIKTLQKVSEDNATGFT